MNLHLLARHRAEAAARLEHLLGIGPSRDADERRELEIAMEQAKAAYAQAELRFQRATSTLTTAEMEDRGING